MFSVRLADPTIITVAVLVQARDWSMKEIIDPKKYNKKTIHDYIDREAPASWSGKRKRQAKEDSIDLMEKKQKEGGDEWTKT